MERLTKRDKENVACWNGANGKSFSDNQGNIYGEAITKLAEYEDAEEQGLLLRLPCKPGDYVWDLWSGYRFEVIGIELHMNGLIVFRCGNKGTEDYASFYLDEIEDRWSLSEPQDPTKDEKVLVEMG